MQLLDTLEKYPGIEFKSWGRQVVIPPSTHPNGHPYQWDPILDFDMAVPNAPDPFVERLRRPSGPSVTSGGNWTSEKLRVLLGGLDVRKLDSNDKWLPFAMAGHYETAGAGIDVIVDWSMTDPNYADRSDEVRSRCVSFSIEKGGPKYTRKTIYKALYAAGRGDLVRWAERSDPQDDFESYDDAGADEPPVPDFIDKMNERFCLVLNGGKLAIFMEDEDGVFDPPRSIWTKMSRTDFVHYHEDERVKILGSQNEVNVAKLWLASPRKRKYPGIVLDPEGRDNGKLNLWRGWSIEPKVGNWSLMRELIEQVLCSGDRPSSEYVLRWMAFMFQHPGTSPEVAVTFRGREGTGKGTLGRALMAIAGAHGLTVSSPAQFAGRFNAHLRTVAFLFADEAFWPGHREAEGVLKQLVTEPVIAFEGKGADIVPGRKLIHLMMASNNEWVIPAGLDARRFAVFDVADVRRNDKAFFTALNAQLTSGGLAAMLHDLLSLDIKGWHPSRGIPKTQALAEQKAFSLEPASKWWMAQLDRGSLPTTELFSWAEGPIMVDPVSKGEMLEDYDRFLKANRVFSAKASHRALAASGRALGLVTAKSRDGKERLWSLPPLAEARRAFEETLGASDLFG